MLSTQSRTFLRRMVQPSRSFGTMAFCVKDKFETAYASKMAQLAKVPAKM
jgi:hypothetical protein